MSKIPYTTSEFSVIVSENHSGVAGADMKNLSHQWCSFRLARRWSRHFTSSQMSYCKICYSVTTDSETKLLGFISRKDDELVIGKCRFTSYGRTVVYSTFYAGVTWAILWIRPLYFIFRFGFGGKKKKGKIGREQKSWLNSFLIPGRQLFGSTDTNIILAIHCATL